MEIYEKRRAGEIVTLDTRGDAHESIDKKKRYPQPALASAPPAAPRTHLSAPRDLEQRSLCSE